MREFTFLLRAWETKPFKKKYKNFDYEIIKRITNAYSL